MFLKVGGMIFATIWMASCLSSFHDHGNNSTKMLHMSLKLRICTLMLLFAAMATLSGLLLPTSAAAALTGSAELEYIKYDAEKNGSNLLNASSFRHNYSLTYNTSGKLMGGRLGQYKGMLGYEWGSLDSELATPTQTLNPSESDGKFAYSGEMLLDPRELPFRLRLYSRDILKNTFVTDTLSGVPSDLLIKPGISTDIINGGTNIQNGATLRFGVKSGMTNGYNAIFRHVPLLLLDYTDIIHRDLRAQTRVDSRLQRLAFISLNKKDNWFHYRVTKFTDHISAASSYSLTEIQLGTVDEMLNRRWIDFTNWIQLSTDIQFTKNVENAKLPIESYDVNLFLTATRRNWELRNFNSFRRQFDHNTTTVKMERNFPVFVNGIWGQDTDWTLRLSSQETAERPPDVALYEARDLLASYRINTFNRSSFSLSHTANLEHFTSNNVKTLVLAASLQTASTRKFSDTCRISGSYDIKRFDTESGNATQTSMVNNLSGTFSYQPLSRQYTFDVLEKINIVDGDSSTSNRTSIRADTDGVQASTGGYKRISTTLKSSWTPTERVQVGGSVTHDLTMNTGADTDQSWSTSAYSRYKRDRISTSAAASYSSSSSFGKTNRQLRASADFAYFVNRDTDFALRGGYLSTDNMGSSFTNFDVTQSFGWRYLSRAGSPRRLLDFTESFTYSRTQASKGNFNASKKLTLGLHYYPWANLSLSNRVSYAWNDPDAQTELVYNGSVALSYAKLQATLDYSYGTRDAKNDNRKESRLAANMKKFF